MNIHQILIRPQDPTFMLLYTDKAGNRNSMALDSASVPAVAQLVAVCERHLPSDDENPNKEKILQEIASLERRVTALRAAIGAA